LLAQTRGKTGSLFRHLAARAIQAQGKPDDDLADAMFAGKFAQPPHVFIAIDAIESEERPRKLRFHFGNGQADARAAVIQRQN
jgi:hypothetical protein